MEEGTSSSSAFMPVRKPTFRFVVGEALPSCPDDGSAHRILGQHPSATILFGCLTLLSLVFALVVGFKFNHVRVFNRKIRTKNISNTLWIVYYVAMTFRGAVNAVELTMQSSYEAVDDVLFVASLVLHGVSAFGLTLALNHQRRYRSSGAFPTPRSFFSWAPW
jgi:hypothetical protein